MFFKQAILNSALIAIAISASAVDSTTAARPNADSATPLAVCTLQTIKLPVPQTIASTSAPIINTISNPAEHALDNYEPSVVGGIPTAGEPSDSWVRLLVLTPRQALLVDLAIQIDGQSFREKRSAWLGGVVASVTKATRSKVAKSVQGDAAPEPETVTTVEPSSPAVATTKIAARNRPTLEQRLATYLSATNGRASHDELQWFIAEAGYGAPIVTLDREISWQRANDEPLWTILDRDQDDTLSRDEINHCETACQSADLNHNDVLEWNEIRDARRKLKLVPRGGHPLVVVLDENSDWPAVANLIRTLCSNLDSATSAVAVAQTFHCSSEIRDLAADLGKVHQLVTIDADLILRIRFSSPFAKQRAETGVALLGGRLDLVRKENALASNNVVSFDVAGDYLEISASQVTEQASADPIGQIAVGAVADGYPLLRVVDRDNDRRLTRRERDSIAGVLAICDRNHDGKLLPGELSIPIRLGVTLGPHVHQLLNEPSASPRTPTRLTSAEVPEWFTTMDKNHDGDLAPNEFLGTSAQFSDLDRDRDNLISGREATTVKQPK